MPDFEVYWRRPRARPHAEPLYRTADGHFQFKYLPAFAVLAIPHRSAAARDRRGRLVRGVGRPSRRARCDGRPASRERRKTASLAGRRHRRHVCQVLRARTRPRSGQHPLRRRRHRRAAGDARRSREVRGGSARGPRDRDQARTPCSSCPGWSRGGSCRRSRPRRAGLAVVLVLPAARYGWDGNVAAAPRMVANGDGNHRAEPGGLRQRIARRDVLPLVWPGELSARWHTALARRFCGVAALVFLSRRGVTFPEGVEGAPAADVDATAVAARLGLRLPDCDAGDRVCGELPRPAAASAALHRDCRRRNDRLRRVRSGGPRKRTTQFMRLSFISLCFFVVIAALVTLRRRKIA